MRAAQVGRTVTATAGRADASERGENQFASRGGGKRTTRTRGSRFIDNERFPKPRALVRFRPEASRCSCQIIRFTYIVSRRQSSGTVPGSSQSKRRSEECDVYRWRCSHTSAHHPADLLARVDQLRQRRAGVSIPTPGALQIPGRVVRGAKCAERHEGLFESCGLVAVEPPCQLGTMIAFFLDDISCVNAKSWLHGVSAIRRGWRRPRPR